ncbi:hypothetical protein EPIR_1890 [Erwinia piriflorinigrans CFBP 5888]|uniref:Uncharacterized protein n=1 Tax=Erwinia piriflorinigrans CFBP 5888 TaxID=1161919 RepID=V5Z8H4_9GAMM|nr:hypothetical protein EPIR_1890 [Erwinia piriflorinigrans CFBP 5888]
MLYQHNHFHQQICFLSAGYFIDRLTQCVNGSL